MPNLLFPTFSFIRSNFGMLRAFWCHDKSGTYQSGDDLTAQWPNSAMSFVVDFVSLSTFFKSLCWHSLHWVQVKCAERSFSGCFCVRFYAFLHKTFNSSLPQARYNAGMQFNINHAVQMWENQFVLIQEHKYPSKCNKYTSTAVTASNDVHFTILFFIIRTRVCHFIYQG